MTDPFYGQFDEDNERMPRRRSYHFWARMGGLVACWAMLLQMFDWEIFGPHIIFALWIASFSLLIL